MVWRPLHQGPTWVGATVVCSALLLLTGVSAKQKDYFRAVHTLEELPRGSLPKHNYINGFVLTDVVTDTFSSVHKGIKYRHFSPQQAGPAGWKDEREKVLTLLKMNEVIYPASDRVDIKSRAEIFTNKDNFPERPQTMEAEEQLRRTEGNQYIADISALKLNITNPYFYGDHAGDDSKKQFGISVWRYDSQDTTILVFRGSSSDGDFSNLAILQGDFAIQRWTDHNKAEYKRLVGSLPEAHDGSAARWFWNGVLQLGILAREGSFAKRTSEVFGASKSDAKQYGYWPFVKQSVRTLLPTNKNVIITGHSQGGMWAQMVSMWLKKTNNVAHPTFAFDPVGCQCMVQKRFKDDMDLVAHPQIMVYRDTYSHYAAIDFQVGNVCIFKQDRTSISKKYCDKVVTYPAARILLPGSFNTLGGNCRYHVHSTMALLRNLGLPGVLDPATGKAVLNSTCAMAAILPSGDTTNCPDGTYRSKPAFGGFIFVFFVMLPILLIMIVICCICLPLRICCLKNNCCLMGGSVFPCLICCCCCKSRSCNACGHPFAPACIKRVTREAETVRGTEMAAAEETSSTV